MPAGETRRENPAAAPSRMASTYGRVRMSLSDRRQKGALETPWLKEQQSNKRAPLYRGEFNDYKDTGVGEFFLSARCLDFALVPDFEICKWSSF